MQRGREQPKLGRCWRKKRIRGCRLQELKQRRLRSIGFRRVESEKRKILAEKRKTELGMAKAIKKLKVEKHRTIEMVKLEEQKALAEDNWNKFTEEKCRTDQMSHQLQ